MAKKSAVARNVKREKLIKKHAAKRAALKAAPSRPRAVPGRALPGSYEVEQTAEECMPGTLSQPL